MKLNFLKQILSVAVLSVAVCGVANAQVQVEIDFTTGAGDLGTQLNGQSTGTFVVEEATAAGTNLSIMIGAITGGSDGTLTAAGSNFGVTGGAQNDFFDTGESATFSFDQNVEFLRADFNQFGANEEIVFSTSNGGSFSITNDTTDFTQDEFTFDPGFFLPAGETFTLTASAGTSASLQNINVNVIPVPEPSSAALLGLLSLGVMARRRR